MGQSTFKQKKFVKSILRELVKDALGHSFLALLVSYAS